MYNIMTMRYDLYNPFLYFGNSTYIDNPFPLSLII